MLIVVNDTAASIGGAITVLESFYQYVRDNDKTNNFVFLLSGQYLEETERIRVILLPQVKKSAFHKLCFDVVTGKHLLEKINPDYVISLQNIITFGYSGVQWLYVHQSIPFQKEKKFSFFKKRECKFAVYQYLIGWFIKQSLQQADHVFVQAKWMKRNIIEQCKKSKEEISVIPVTLNAKTERVPYCCDGRRFFYPTTGAAVYKNHQVILDAVKLLREQTEDHYLVRFTLREEQLPDSDYVIEYCGSLNKEEMKYEYARSVLLFPSYIETVGLPLIEAMKAGALIFAADCEYAHEVLDRYANAYYFPPFDAKALAILMSKSIHKELVSDGEPMDNMQDSNGWHMLIKD